MEQGGLSLFHENRAPDLRTQVPVVSWASSPVRTVSSCELILSPSFDPQLLASVLCTIWMAKTEAGMVAEAGGLGIGAQLGLHSKFKATLGCVALSSKNKQW